MKPQTPALRNLAQLIQIGYWNGHRYPRVVRLRDPFQGRAARSVSSPANAMSPAIAGIWNWGNRPAAGQSIVLRSVQGGVRADYAYEVHPHDEGTSRVTLTADCQSTGVLWRVMWPLVRIAIRASDAKQLRLLRATLEDT